MLRTVVRATHVECTSVDVGDHGIVLTGVLCGGPRIQPGALFVLSRRGPHTLNFTVPVQVLGTHSFRAQAPVRRVVDHRLERWEDWDWWLQPDPHDRAKVRICHVLEDFPDVKSAFAYPGVPLVGDEPSEFSAVHPAKPVWVRPYCSASGAMAMNVVDR
jgi:hypothetical protein